MEPHSNRESWLQQCANELRPLFSAHGAPLPDRIRFSCGWPSSRGLRAKNRVLGECWEAAASADGTIEIFINPIISDALEVAETLVHELAHSVVGRKHGKPFKQLAVAVGLIGPMKATRADDALREHLRVMIAQLGPYPHGAINVDDHSGGKQSTRLLKAVCTADGYTIRITRKWIAYGLPTCPCGSQLRQELDTE